MFFCRYIPQEEVPLYESKGKQLAKNTPKYPVGLSEEYIKEAQLKREQEQKKLQQKQNQQSSIPGLPAQQQNKKKKKKKAQSDSNPSQKITVLEKCPISEQLLNSYSSPSDAASLNNEDGGWTTVTSRSRNNTNKTASQPAPPQPSNKKEKKNEAVKEISDALAATEPAKRVKNLKKRLREIDLIEEKRNSGVKLDKDQLHKLTRREEIEREIEALSKMLGLL